MTEPVNLDGWWIVWRPRRVRSKAGGFKRIAVAAFASKAMALSWIMEAPHRSRDEARPMASPKPSVCKL